MEDKTYILGFIAGTRGGGAGASAGGEKAQAGSEL